MNRKNLDLAIAGVIAVLGCVAAAVPMSDLATAGTASITISAEADGGTAGPLAFAIEPAASFG